LGGQNGEILDGGEIHRQCFLNFVPQARDELCVLKCLLVAASCSPCACFSTLAFAPRLRVLRRAASPMRNIRSADAWLPQNQPRRRDAAAGIVFFAASNFLAVSLANNRLRIRLPKGKDTRVCFRRWMAGQSLTFRFLQILHHHAGHR
jgi:hypothetical protein